MSSKKSKVVIIGANGYVGRNMSYYLNNEGYEIINFDIQIKTEYKWMEYYKLDILDKKSLELIPKDTDFIFVFSGITGTYEGFDKYKDFIEVNEIGLLNILDYMRHSEINARVIFPSTRLVYSGVRGKSLTEEMEKNPKTIYAINKLTCENILKVYSETFGIKYNVFRICVPYGNLIGNDYSYGTIGFFLNQALNSRKITLFGDGALRRTFTNIEDLCNLFKKTIEIKESENQVYNIGGEDLSLKEVAQKISDKFPNTVIEYTPWNEKSLIIESGDTIFDSCKLDYLVNYKYRHYFGDWLNNNF
jgi:UDP-glucose 4-epimerase